MGVHSLFFRLLARGDAVPRAMGGIVSSLRLDPFGSSSDRLTERGRSSDWSEKATGAEVDSDGLHGALAIGMLATAAIYILHPLLAVRDVDGFAYLIGARSLHAGNGYRSLSGDPLNHWPPAYSILLSPFDDPIVAATAINYCSYGLALGLLYYLLRQSGWTWQSSLGLVLGLGSGFFRLLANSVHADILTYAVFLIGLGLAKRTRLWSSIILSLLIPIKLISVVFLPASIGSDLLTLRFEPRRLFAQYFPAAIVSAACVGSILLFNRMTTQEWVPESYGETSLRSFSSGVYGFLFSIPREFLFDWHGTMHSVLPMGLFLACTSVLCVVMLAMRPAAGGAWYLAYGLLFIVGSGLLLLVRAFTPHVRLLAYGPIALFLGMKPRPWANKLWLGYGLISLATGVLNALTVNSLGGMDPRYKQLAVEVAAVHRGQDAIATNSFHILDLHANIPSIPVKNDAEASKFDELLWVTLPNFDPLATTVTPMDRPGSEWCEVEKFAGGVLFKRCG